MKPKNSRPETLPPSTSELPPPPPFWAVVEVGFSDGSRTQITIRRPSAGALIESFKIIGNGADE